MPQALVFSRDGIVGFGADGSERRFVRFETTGSRRRFGRALTCPPPSGHTASPVRILHTSDWHLGQLFYQYDRTEEHDRFLAWLLDTLTAEHADALLIAGDVFDHANPSAIAHKQFYRFLTDARRRTPHLSIVVISGNHDSPGRLEAPSPFFDALDITVMGQVPRHDDGTIDAARLVVPLRNSDGEVAAWCLAVPFLRTGDLPATAAEATARKRPPTPARGAYAAGVARVYTQALDAALAPAAPARPSSPWATAAWRAASMSLESERPILAAASTPSRPTSSPATSPTSPSATSTVPSRSATTEAALLGQPAAAVVRRDSTTPTRWCPSTWTAARWPTSGPFRCRASPRCSASRTSPPRRKRWSPPARARPARRRRGVRPYLEVRVRIERPEPGLRSRIEEALATKPVRLARIETDVSVAPTPAPTSRRPNARRPRDTAPGQRLPAGRTGTASARKRRRSSSPPSANCCGCRARRNGHEDPRHPRPQHRLARRRRSRWTSAANRSRPPASSPSAARRARARARCSTPSAWRSTTTRRG